MTDAVIQAWESFVRGCEARAAAERAHAERRKGLAAIIATRSDAETMHNLVDQHLAQAGMEDDLAAMGRDRIAERMQQLGI